MITMRTTTPRYYWAPWEHLTREEQEEGVTQARRKGKRLAEIALANWNPSKADTPEAARPALYVQTLLAEAPLSIRQRWYAAGPQRWLGDPRVCAFGAAWEETRRRALSLPLPMDREGRAAEMRRTALSHARSRKTYREVQEALAQIQGDGRLPDPATREAQGVILGAAARDYWAAQHAAETAALLYTALCYEQDGLP